MTLGPSKSVFSRLLTLEAAWQEYQAYFGTTYALHQNTNPSSPPAAATSEEPGPGNKPPPIGSKPHLIHGGLKNGSRYSEISLLHGYPDVEKNVNDKFHDWEIVPNKNLSTMVGLNSMPPILCKWTSYTITRLGDIIYLPRASTIARLGRHTRSRSS
jgi:hypothetical protein